MLYQGWCSKSLISLFYLLPLLTQTNDLALILIIHCYSKKLYSRSAAIHTDQIYKVLLLAKCIAHTASDPLSITVHPFLFADTYSTF